MTADVRVAGVTEGATVAAILAEAAAWLAQSGAPMWQLEEIKAELVAEQVAAGTFALAWVAAEAAGTIRFQLEDPIFWPDALTSEAAYVHRLAVRRKYAGTGVSAALLSWAAVEARAHGRSVLRLDCDAERMKLRDLYERFGFRYHSDRHVDPYVVARYEYIL
jgi:GNAT superfamily N-acetyltransferase